ncbi:MAG: AEC family transporter [Chlorobi bacterium]|nr:AEC family transporter [Chlorobiota bacterium]
MDSVILVGFVGAGIAWRAVARQWSPEIVRRYITTVVFYVLLPALTFRSMVRAPFGEVLWQIPLVASTGIAGTVALAHIVLRWSVHLDPSRYAAALLSAAWGNVTYLGIPILVATLSGETVFVAVLYDFAASTPLLWTLGVFIAASGSGGTVQTGSVVRKLAAVPPLWTAVLGIAAGASGITVPLAAERVLIVLSSAVMPLMMFVLGLSLRWEYLRYWRELVPVAGLKLLVSPLLVLCIGLAIGLHGTTFRAALLEAAMPTMMLTLVVAERYRLDVEYVAAAIALTTVASTATLPLWWGIGSMLG